MVNNKYNFKYLYKIKYYNSLFYNFSNKFIGKIIKKGNKERSLQFYFKLKYMLKKKTKRDPNLILLVSLIKSMFKFYFIKLRLGSIQKDIPMPLSKIRQVRFVVKELIKLARYKRKNSLNINKLGNLILLTSKRQGPLIIKNNKNYRKALNNRSFLFFKRKK